MITPEFEIRRAARYLQSLMHELHEHKHMKGKPVSEVVSGGAGFGPGTPGNGEAISLYCEIERELSIWLCDWRTGRHGANDQLGWVAFNAEWVAAQADSEGLLTELRRWAGLVERAVGRGPTIKDLANRQERRQTAGSICYRLHSTGYTHVTPQHLTTWAARGHISKTPRGYLLTEVMTWVTREK